MKRYLIYAAGAVLSLLAIPNARTDVSDLIPVELVSIYMEEGNVCIAADTGDFGRGTDLDAALSDLRAAAPGKIFLETADYLVVTQETDVLVPAMMQHLRPSTEVCMGTGNNAQAAAFLSVHKPGITLNDIRQGQRQVPVLTGTEERYHLDLQEKP